MDGSPPRRRTSIDMVWMPIANLNDEQLVKFLERTRRRYALYGRDSVDIGVLQEGIAQEDEYGVTLSTTPPIRASLPEQYVNLFQVSVKLRDLKRWYGPHLRRILVKLKKNPRRFKTRTIFPALQSISMLPKHPKETVDKRLHFEATANRDNLRV